MSARYAIAVPALLFIANTLHAQHSGFGVKGGLLLSDVRSGAMSSNLLPGATAGLYAPLRAGERFELQPELLVTALGASYTLPDDDRATVRTVYLQLPLSAKVYIGNTFNLQAGFLMGRLLLAQQRTGDGTEDLTEGYNSWDHGIILGLGADLITGLDLGVRYYNGMKPVLKEDEVLFPRNRSFSLTAGYRIGRFRAPKFTKRRG